MDFLLTILYFFAHRHIYAVKHYYQFMQPGVGHVPTYHFGIGIPEADIFFTRHRDTAMRVPGGWPEHRAWVPEKERVAYSLRSWMYSGFTSMVAERNPGRSTMSRFLREPRWVSRRPSKPSRRPPMMRMCLP